MRILIISIAALLSLTAQKRFPIRPGVSGGGGGLSPTSYTANFPLETIPSLTPGQCYLNDYGNHVCQISPRGFNHRYPEPSPINPTSTWVLVDGSITSGTAGPSGLSPNTGVHMIHMGPRTGLSKPVSAPTPLPTNPGTTAQITGPQFWNPGDPSNPALPANYEIFATTSSIPNSYPPTGGQSSRNEQKLWKLACTANCTASNATWQWSLLKDFTPLFDWNNDAFCSANCNIGNPARSYAATVDNFGAVTDLRDYLSGAISGVIEGGNRIIVDFRSKTKQSHVTMVWTRAVTADCPSGDCVSQHYANALWEVTSDPAFPGFKYTGPYSIPFAGGVLTAQVVHPDQTARGLRVAMQSVASKFAPHALATAGGLESITGSSTNIAHGATLSTGVIMYADLGVSYGTVSGGSPNWVSGLRTYNLASGVRTSPSAGIPSIISFGMAISDFLGDTHMSSSPRTPNWAFVTYFKIAGRYGTQEFPGLPDGNSMGREIIAVRTDQPFTIPTHPNPWPNTGFVRLGQHNSCLGGTYNSGGVEYARGCKGLGQQGLGAVSIKGDGIIFSSSWSRQDLSFIRQDSPAYSAAEYVVPRVMWLEVPASVTSTYP